MSALTVGSWTFPACRGDTMNHAGFLDTNGVGGVGLQTGEGQGRQSIKGSVTSLCPTLSPAVGPSTHG